MFCVIIGYYKIIPQPMNEPWWGSGAKLFVHFQTKKRQQVENLDENNCPVSEAECFLQPRPAPSFSQWRGGGGRPLRPYLDPPLLIIRLCELTPVNCRRLTAALLSSLSHLPATRNKLTRPALTPASRPKLVIDLFTTEGWKAELT